MLTMHPYFWCSILELKGAGVGAGAGTGTGIGVW